MTHRARRASLALSVAVAALAPRAGAQQRVTKETAPAVVAAPRTVLLRGESLLRTRERLRAGDARLRPAYDALIAEARAALDVGPFSVMQKQRTAPSGDKHDYVSMGPYWWPDTTKPNGLPYVRRDGEVNPESRRDSDSPAFARMADAVGTLALAGWLSGDDAYARRAATLLRVWFLDPATRMNPHLDYGQRIPGVVEGRGIGLIDTRHLADVVDAMALLDGSPSWTAADRRGMQAWARDFLRWMTTSKNGVDERGERNNHGSWYDVQATALALFVGDTALARRIVDESGRARIASQIAPGGDQPLEAARTRGLHYTVFNLEALERLAELGRHVGVDLWRWQAPSGAGIRRAVLFVAPYADGAHPWPVQEVGNPMTPREFVAPLRRAATALDDPAIAAALAKLPAAVAAADRSRLLFPDAP